MKTKIFWISFLLLASLAVVAADNPNIIFILVDDLGPDWVGSYGSEHLTPHVDRLAASGVRFETAWTSPICTPTRVMMLTGKYPGRTGWTEHYDVPRWGGAGLIPEKFPTWPQQLRRAGYTTAIAGKWQINDLRAEPDILARHGFERHCVWPGVEEGNPPSAHRYWDAYLQTDGKRGTHTGHYGPDVTQRFALDFIRENRAWRFLLYYPMISVHAPNEPTPLNRANPPHGEAALYAGSVTYMDRQVGELLDELDRLGLAKNTLVIFAGDNGSSTGGTHAGRAVAAGKGRTIERGVHVPLIVRAPGVSGGWATPALTDFSDLYPTLLDFAGINRLSGESVDGRSWAPLLKKDPAYLPRSWIYAQRDRSRTVRDHRFKLDTEGGFFEIAIDPDQKTPVVPSRDPSTRAAHSALVAALAAVPAQAPTPPFPGYTPDRMRALAEPGKNGKK
ncbi:MAG: Arylsulfatase precursor [Verrucomicrobiota bacterium]|jgi:arylsulfatase A-like enzyme